MLHVGGLEIFQKNFQKICFWEKIFQGEILTHGGKLINKLRPIFLNYKKAISCQNIFGVIYKLQNESK